MGESTLELKGVYYQQTPFSKPKNFFETKDLKLLI